MVIVSECAETNQLNILSGYKNKLKASDEQWRHWNAMFDLGLNLVPAVPYQKTPLVPYKQWQTDRIDQLQWDEWRSKYGKPMGCNMLLLTGHRNGLVLADADDAEAEALVKTRCPETPLLVRTRKGWHRYYRHPGEGHYVKQIIKIVIDGKKYNLDIKGEGCYGVAPYSYRECGHCYEWDTEWTAELIASAPIYDPAWLTPDAGTHHEADNAAGEQSLPPFTEGGKLLPHVVRYERAKSYLAAVPGCRAGAEDVESKMLRLAAHLVHGFMLDDSSVENLLMDFGQRKDNRDADGTYYPWMKLTEIRHKVSEARKRPERYSGTVGDKAHDRPDDDERVHRVIQPFDAGPDPELLSTTPTMDAVVLSKRDPFGNAKKFVAVKFGSAGGVTLRHWQGVFYRYRRTHYSELGDDEIRSVAWQFMASAERVEKVSDGFRNVPFDPSTADVSGMIDATRAIVQIPKDVTPPCWLHEDIGTQYLPLSNGLLDLDEFRRSGSVTIQPHSPLYFNLNVLPHEYDPAATCPVWEKFLDEVFDGDAERIDLLEEWMAYNLLCDTRQQAIMLMCGAAGSGKGTIADVMTKLVGRKNIASPSFKDLCGRFWAEPLIGKMSAIVGDGHTSHKDDVVALLEKLKTVSGEDTVSIDRKGRMAIDGQITARFTILVNTLPYLPDASSGLMRRLFLIPFTKSFKINPDRYLRDKLEKELPGILNRTLTALRRFMARGHFIQPKAGNELLNTINRHGSPIEAFFQDCCDVGDTHTIPKDELFIAYKRWCDDENRICCNRTQFAVNLYSANPAIKDYRDRSKDAKGWHFTNINLNGIWKMKMKTVSSVTY